MKIIESSYQILTDISGSELTLIEKAGRTCYKSEDKITQESAKSFVKGLIFRGHEAMLEHSSLSVRFICDRGVSHELVRHRLASFAQESTRYCNYSNDKFGHELTFIKPCWLAEVDSTYEIWLKHLEEVEKLYFTMLDLGYKPQEVRGILPNCLKTEVVMTANYREWRHFFNLRAAGATGPAHPQMEELTIPLLKEISGLIPVVFDDIWEKTEARFTLTEEEKTSLIKKLGECSVARKR